MYINSSFGVTGACGFLWPRSSVKIKGINGQVRVFVLLRPALFGQPAASGRRDGLVFFSAIKYWSFYLQAVNFVLDFSGLVGKVEEL